MEKETNRCLQIKLVKKYEKKYKYIMFFDADEFLIADDLLKGKSIVIKF